MFSFDVLLTALHRLPSVTPSVLRAVILGNQHDRYASWTAATLRNWGLDSERASRVISEIQSLDLATAAVLLEKWNIRVLPISDPRYPAYLRETAAPPPMLYVRGSIDVLGRPALAIVGTRRPSDYGLHLTNLITTDLARAGVISVSGLAYGIDIAAHRASLKAGAPTIAVFGSGIDIVYPWAHQADVERIIAHGGAVVSEFPIGTHPDRHQFPQRNRIIAGLARGVWLVEAGEKSGALVTMKYGLDANRDLYVLPADCTRSTSIGSLNWLKLGATPVTTAQDFRISFPAVDGGRLTTRYEPNPTDETERQIIDHLDRVEPRHIDDIADTSRLESSVITAVLALLEIRGLVRHHGGMRYTTLT